MLSWIIQFTIISIILIFLVHYLINFFKSTLTVPKIKDLVNAPNQKYENMYNVIRRNSAVVQETPHEPSTDEYTLIDLLPNKEEDNMKTKLKDFLKKQMRPSNDAGTDLATLDSMSNIDSFSSY
jgi:hypothetical protein